MREGMLHIRDVEGPKKTASMETRLEAMEQQVFKCQGMVERGLNANHKMIMEFSNKHRIDANDIGKHLSRLYDRVDQLQGQIYDLQNQNLDTHISCIDLSMVYTNDPIWVEKSIYNMEQLLAEDKYKVISFDLKYNDGRTGYDQMLVVAHLCVCHHVVAYLYCMSTRTCKHFIAFFNSLSYIFSMMDTTNDVKVVKTSGLTYQNLVNIQGQYIA
ncbi:hypothetical protein D1007_52411 [Hordeum vulgare]|nr:hypothetical protein D1007_52411 [Hordeum vulgare]